MLVENTNFHYIQNTGPKENKNLENRINIQYMKISADNTAPNNNSSEINLQGSAPNIIKCTVENEENKPNDEITPEENYVDIFTREKKDINEKEDDLDDYEISKNIETKAKKTKKKCSKKHKKKIKRIKKNGNNSTNLIKNNISIINNNNDDNKIKIKKDIYYENRNQKDDLKDVLNIENIINNNSENNLEEIDSNILSNIIFNIIGPPESQNKELENFLYDKEIFSAFNSEKYPQEIDFIEISKINFNVLRKKRKKK